jgi:hypothetical protein
MIREFVHPAVVKECDELFGFLGRRDHHHGLSALHQGDEREPAPSGLPERARSDVPRSTLKPLGRWALGQHFVDEPPEQRRIVSLATPRPSLVCNERRELEGGALAIGLSSELFHEILDAPRTVPMIAVL